MISAKLGHFLDRPLRSFALRLRLNPTYVTVAGFLITTLAALVIPSSIRTGGVLIILGGFFDALDGVVARTNGTASKSGAFLDSVLDRFSDAFLFLGVGAYFLRAGNEFYTFLCFFALISSFGVSYARARAEGLGYECTVGIMERTERIAVLTLGCLIPVILWLCIWIILIGSTITVFQRVRHVWKSMGKST